VLVLAGFQTITRTGFNKSLACVWRGGP